jgi:hypothetical protein
MAKLDRFDRLVPSTPWVNPWQPNGTLRVDYDILRSLLGAAVGTSQASGIVAAAVDVWAAEELRRAGFDPDEVWPRRTSPRVLPRDVRNFVKLGLTRALRTQVEGRYSSSGARKALPAEAHVMGSAYSKQADVVVASWSAGVELLISTKTMLSSYQKNLRNRFEEGYGDAKNLRGRHPLASLGFAFVVGSEIPDVSLEFAIDMLRKLTTEPDVYDCACLIVVEGAAETVEEPAADERDIDDEPTAMLNLREDDDLDADVDEDGAQTDGIAEVDLHLESVPSDLSAEHFFQTLIGAALDRMPVAVYPEVRHRRQSALSGDS